VFERFAQDAYDKLRQDAMLMEEVISFAGHRQEGMEGETCEMLREVARCGNGDAPVKLRRIWRHVEYRRRGESGRL